MGQNSWHIDKRPSLEVLIRFGDSIQAQLGDILTGDCPVAQFCSHRPNAFHPQRTIHGS
jgi:hypothetical protein